MPHYGPISRWLSNLRVCWGLAIQARRPERWTAKKPSRWNMKLTKTKQVYCDLQVPLHGPLFLVACARLASKIIRTGGNPSQMSKSDFNLHWRHSRKPLPIKASLEVLLIFLVHFMSISDLPIRWVPQRSFYLQSLLASSNQVVSSKVPFQQIRKVNDANAAYRIIWAQVPSDKSGWD